LTFKARNNLFFKSEKVPTGRREIITVFFKCKLDFSCHWLATTSNYCMREENLVSWTNIKLKLSKIKKHIQEFDESEKRFALRVSR